MSAVTCYLGLGSNMGDRLGHLSSGLEYLDEDELSSIFVVSPVYETTPVGGPPQSDFLNAVCSLSTRRDPGQLLELCADIEERCGRTRSEKWGPRTLDIDILLYGDRIIVEPGLRIPHPRMTERIFVLKPMVDIAPNVVHPETDQRMAELLMRVEDTGISRREESLDR